MAIIEGHRHLVGFVMGASLLWDLMDAPSPAFSCWLLVPSYLGVSLGLDRSGVDSTDVPEAGTDDLEVSSADNSGDLSESDILVLRMYMVGRR